MSAKLLLCELFHGQVSKQSLDQKWRSQAELGNEGKSQVLERNRIPFYKMHGGGNDFVLIDHRNRFIPEAGQPEFARQVCHRQLGIGADGLILIEASPTAANFRWRFYNADGSEPEMCGNGGRCAARFAVLNGIAPAEMSFETLAGTIKAEVKGRRVKLLMAGIGDFRLEQTIPLEDATLLGHFLKVGVPHVAVPVPTWKRPPSPAGAGRCAFMICLPRRAPTSISSRWKAPKP